MKRFRIYIISYMLFIGLIVGTVAACSAQTWQPSAKADKSAKVETKERCNGSTKKKEQCKIMVDKTKNKPDSKGHYYCHFHIGQAE